MSTLSPRLGRIAELVIRGGVVCDVGTDHAYLPAYLLDRGISTRAVVTDIHAGPLDAARRTLTEAGVLEKATLVLGDGLTDVPCADITDIVIAGMGGEMIAHILTDCAWWQQVHLILQPMTKISLVRQLLADAGFFPWNEEIVAEGDKFYTLIETQTRGEPHILDFAQAEIGLLDLHDPTARAYLTWRRAHSLEVAQSVAKSAPEKVAYWQNLARSMAEMLTITEE